MNIAIRGANFNIFPLSYGKRSSPSNVSGVPGDGIKRDPDMDKSAVWASTDCMAVSPFPGYVSCRHPVQGDISAR